jgi:hypothetical protein
MRISSSGRQGQGQEEGKEAGGSILSCSCVLLLPLPPASCSRFLLRSSAAHARIFLQTLLDGAPIDVGEEGLNVFRALGRFVVE